MSELHAFHKETPQNSKTKESVEQDLIQNLLDEVKFLRQEMASKNTIINLLTENLNSVMHEFTQNPSANTEFNSMQKNTSNDDLVSPKRTVKLLKPNYLSNRNSLTNVNRYSRLSISRILDFSNSSVSRTNCLVPWPFRIH